MTDKIVAVWWQDAYVTLRKVKPGEPAGLTCSIGHIANEDDTFIYISNYFDGISGKWSDPWTAIPKVLIIKQENLNG